MLIETSGSDEEHDQEKLTRFLENTMTRGLVQDGTLASNSRETTVSGRPPAPRYLDTPRATQTLACMCICVMCMLDTDREGLKDTDFIKHPHRQREDELIQTPTPTQWTRSGSVGTVDNWVILFISVSFFRPPPPQTQTQRQSGADGRSRNPGDVNCSFFTHVSYTCGPSRGGGGRASGRGPSQRV